MNIKKLNKHNFLKIHEYVNKIDEELFDIMNFATNDQPYETSVIKFSAKKKNM